MQKQRSQRFLLIALATLVFSTGALHAQASAAPTTDVDSYTPEQLKQMGAPLVSKAAANGGIASVPLVHYPGHFTMLAYRSQSGGAELHKQFADIFVIVDGSAKLISGGSIVAPKSTSPIEMIGTGILNGKERTVHAGDIVHIPAGTPHQMKLEPGSGILYFVVKVQENTTPQ
jgi:mannose-6-phosphate isomerase-like protein (cupin superfamily)